MGKLPPGLAKYMAAKKKGTAAKPAAKKSMPSKVKGSNKPRGK